MIACSRPRAEVHANVHQRPYKSIHADALLEPDLANKPIAQRVGDGMNLSQQ